MIGNVIEANFLVLLNYPAAAALSIILMAVILVFVGGVREAKRNGGPAVSGEVQAAAALGELAESEPATPGAARRAGGGSGSATGCSRPTRSWRSCSC